jgi:anthraniloyl-CoA monooxygenase
MWQTPFSDFVRNEVDIPTITSGFISSMDQVNTLLLNRRADLVALGRPLLLDASFVRNAQAWESVPMEYLHVPEPYQIAVPHQFAIAAGERKAMMGMKKALKPLTHKKS